MDVFGWDSDDKYLDDRVLLGIYDVAIRKKPLIDFMCKYQTDILDIYIRQKVRDLRKL